MKISKGRQNVLEWLFLFFCLYLSNFHDLSADSKIIKTIILLVGSSLLFLLCPALNAAGNTYLHKWNQCWQGDCEIYISEKSFTPPPKTSFIRAHISISQVLVITLPISMIVCGLQLPLKILSDNDNLPMGSIIIQSGHI